MSTNGAGNVTAPAAQPQGLVSWWQAEGDATDALGMKNGVNHGVLFGPGRVGQAFEFVPPVSTLPNNIDVPNSPSLQPPALTVMAWISHLGNPGGDSYIVSKGANGCQAASYALFTGAGNLQFYVYDGGAFVPSPDAPSTVWDGNWHLVVGTFDGAAVRLYVDGVQVGTGTPRSLAISYALPDGQGFLIGAYLGSCSLGFTGSIDEVRLFNRALSPSEILSVYQTTPSI